METQRKSIALAYEFLSACARKSAELAGYEPQTILWREFTENDRQQHLITAQMFISDPAITALETHNAWVERRALDGWTYGPNYDADTKTSNQHLPWDQLPEKYRLAEEAGVAAMRVAFNEPHWLTHDTIGRMAVRVAGINSENWVRVFGELGGPHLVTEPLMWGTMANCRAHLSALSEIGEMSPRDEMVARHQWSQLNEFLDSLNAPQDQRIN